MEGALCHNELRVQECRKNQGHHSFIPIKQFSIEHLPEKCRDPRVFASISSLARLTCRLVIPFTSPHRPTHCPRLGEAYPFSVGDKTFRDRSATRAGTGFVSNVFISNRRYVRQSPEGVAVQEPKWLAQIIVTTARHVIYDQSEARSAYVELFYDDEESRNSKMVRLKGRGSSFVDDVSLDVVWISCVTEDLDLAQALWNDLNRGRQLQRHLAKSDLIDSIKSSLMKSEADAKTGKWAEHIKSLSTHEQPISDNQRAPQKASETRKTGETHTERPPELIKPILENFDDLVKHDFVVFNPMQRCEAHSFILKANCKPKQDPEGVLKNGLHFDVHRTDEYEAMCYEGHDNSLLAPSRDTFPDLKIPRRSLRIHNRKDLKRKQEEHQENSLSAGPTNELSRWKQDTPVLKKCRPCSGNTPFRASWCEAASDTKETSGVTSSRTSSISKDNLVVIISHPHGSSKHVTIGQWEHTEKILASGNMAFTRFYHNAPTCPGSSGGPVWRRTNAFGRHVHSRALGSGRALTSIGVDITPRSPALALRKAVPATCGWNLFATKTSAGSKRVSSDHGTDWDDWKDQRVM